MSCFCEVSHLMYRDMAVRASTDNLRCAVPCESEQLCLILSFGSASLENIDRSLLVACVPEFQKTIQGARHEYILCPRVNLNLRDVPFMTLKSLRLFHLRLP